ncbi:P-loop NTPase fold protein [Actinokineospora auranticolor]|uniref:KAP-like P-loop domain-containing protein n=1 Tax=Actinokineospora auranticolor TaxID=155976 RepID=A0A2S6GR14_9PSEU|nr:P-loop NTPase fold protein [Actinokineospora auranticolor]PPK67613.1 KAP-like P-loop domain-containing protein [Actinokineospora auranticolor]
MTDPALPYGNPFVLPDGESNRPLRPHVHPEDVPLVQDIGGLGDNLDLLAKSRSVFVAVTGPSGTGRTTSLNVCAWELLTRERVSEVVDVSVEPLRTDRAHRMSSACARVAEELGFGEDTELVAAVEDPAEFYRLLEELVDCAVVLPPVESAREVEAYLELGTRKTVFLAESPEIGVYGDALLLSTLNLRPGEARRFIDNRLDHWSKRMAFPRVGGEALAKLEKDVTNVGLLHNLMVEVYATRLAHSPTRPYPDTVTVEDILLGLNVLIIGIRVTPPVSVKPPVGTGAKWLSDAVAEKDLLKREGVAQVITNRMVEAAKNEPGTSILVHLDGRWGTGKSTLLSFVERKLTEKDFLVVRFDAWQQARLSPPWWALLTNLRGAVLADRKRLRRWGFRIAELRERLRRTGAAYVLPLVLTILTVGGLALTLLGINSTTTFADALKVVVAVLTATGSVWVAARGVGKAMLWRSARGARLFEQSNTNPMVRVAEHFDWLLSRSSKPVVFFIDDLDRCKHDYVVDLLDAVQTLVRTTPGAHPFTRVSPRAAYFVVAADGAWLRRSYTATYSTFDSDPARAEALGYQFMDKLFQLTVPMPSVSESAQRHLLDSLLGVADTGVEHPAVKAVRERLTAAKGETEVLRIMNSAPPDVRAAVAPDAAVAVSEPGIRAHTEHLLSDFTRLLGTNPREVKLFVNTYTMLRAVRMAEAGTPPHGLLALWSIVRVRWPEIADHLQRSPDAVRGILNEGWLSEDFPERLRAMASGSALRAVVGDRKAGPLTPEGIRRCCGLE